MTPKKYNLHFLCIGLAILVLTGCRASGNRHAPVEERNGTYRAPVEERAIDVAKKSASSGIVSKVVVPQEANNRTKTYVIKKGDTLYSIAFENGMDYREVADLNNIKNPAAIQIGQLIHLNEAGSSGADIPVVHIAETNTIKSQPKVAKLPYSEQAVVQIENLQQDAVQIAPMVLAPVVPVVSKSTSDKVTEIDAGTDDNVKWSLPAKGKLISGYSESENRKGVDIAGNKGQAVMASAGGKVVYSGSGLRGYGKLVIIKHNKTYLSAYAHNDKILVKEGQSVSTGQKIAEMGSSDADQVKLHFEIRKFGKPVDPEKYLNLSQS